MANEGTVPSLPSFFSTQEELEQLLLQGVESGEPIDATPEFWAELRRDASTQFEAQQAGLRKAS